MSETMIARPIDWGTTVASAAVGITLGVLITTVVFLTVPGLVPELNSSSGDHPPTAELSSVSSTNAEYIGPTSKNSSNAGKPRFAGEANSHWSDLSVQSLTDAWNARTNDDVENVGQTVDFIQIGESLVAQRGIAAMEFIHDSLSDENLREAVMCSVLLNAISDGYEFAFIEALNLNSDSRQWTLHAIVQRWARVDAMAAFNAIGELASTDPAIRLLQRRAAWEWAEKDPKAAMASMETIPDNMRDFAEEKALFAMARQSPPDAVEYLADLSGSQREATLATEIAVHWAQRDPMRALEWAKSVTLSKSEFDFTVLEKAYRTFAQSNPERALQLALKEPTDFIRRGMEAYVIEEVALSDVDKAFNMLGSVRDDGQTLFHAYKSVGRAMVETHLEFDRALELAENVPYWSAEFYRDLSLHWAAAHPVELLHRIESIPPEHQSLVATHLITINQVSLVLTKVQLQLAMKFLNESDREVIAALSKNYVNMVQFATHSNVEYSADELAELETKNRMAREEIKRRREGN